MIVARAWGVLPAELDQLDGRTYRLMVEQLQAEAEARSRTD